MKSSTPANEDLSMAGLVHDLNNVFQTLVGVAMQLQENPDSAKLAATVLRSVERGQRIAEGMQSGAKEATSFETVLGQAEDFLTDFQAAARGPVVEIVRAVEPGVQVDGPAAWERVLINLFLNSVRAMPEGGKIYVTARTRNGTVEILVSDEGTGIPKEVREHLFEPHVSTHGSTGLGLHIVESIVKASGGSIHASPSATGRGAEFVIRLGRASKVKRAAR